MEALAWWCFPRPVGSCTDAAAAVADTNVLPACWMMPEETPFADSNEAEAVCAIPETAPLIFPEMVLKIGKRCDPRLLNVERPLPLAAFDPSSA